MTWTMGGRGRRDGSSTYLKPQSSTPLPRSDVSALSTDGRLCLLMGPCSSTCMSTNVDKMRHKFACHHGKCGNGSRQAL